MVQLGGIGGVECLFIIIIVVVLFFGVRKIPEIAGSFGRASAEFEKARIQAKYEIKQIKHHQNTNSNAAATATEREKLESVAEILGIEYTDKSDDELLMDIELAINTRNQKV